jgi:hypothetical protein
MVVASTQTFNPNINMPNTNKDVKVVESLLIKGDIIIRLDKLI